MEAEGNDQYWKKKIKEILTLLKEMSESHMVKKNDKIKEVDDGKTVQGNGRLKEQESEEKTEGKLQKKRSSWKVFKEAKEDMRNDRRRTTGTRKRRSMRNRGNTLKKTMVRKRGGSGLRKEERGERETKKWKIRKQNR